MASNQQFQHVNNLWDDDYAQQLSPLARLVYRSNLLGADQRITNTGGGNTSAKLPERDPITSEEVPVLWVKGSGGDLRTAKEENFASLYLERLTEELFTLYNGAEIKGVKTATEDAMVALYPQIAFNLNKRAASIDTPLHAFVPYKHVDHTHPNAVIALAAAKDGKALTRAVYGEEVIWLPWQRPGFDLGLQLLEVCRNHPQAKGVVLGQHGLINWADDDKACYLLSLELIERAATYLREHGSPAPFGEVIIPPLPEAERWALLTRLLPAMRGLVSKQKKMVATVGMGEEVLELLSSSQAAALAALGTSCPDHFLRTKIKPLFVNWNPHQENEAALISKLETGLTQYRQDYLAYYERCKHPDSPVVRDATPSVILIPGVGMVAWGKTKSESRVTAEFYTCATAVMRGAQAVSRYQALPLQEAFDIEYWALEEAKLQRMPPEQALVREVVLVIGAGYGIGKATAVRLAREGAHVVCADLDEGAAKATAQEIAEWRGQGIGVAGSGLSNCGPSVGFGVDITNRDSVAQLMTQVSQAYGGLDHVVITAGVFVTPDASGMISDEAWALTYSVNVTGAYIVATEAQRIWEAQQLRGSLVLATSANAVVPKMGSLAYDTSKAAANHLVRELALTLAPYVRVNGVAPATVVEGSTMFPRERVISSLTKYGLPAEDNEATETLRERLAQFYAERTLLGRSITLADQAEAIWLLVSPSLAKTSGQIIAVDGGLKDAFLR